MPDEQHDDRAQRRSDVPCAFVGRVVAELLSDEGREERACDAEHHGQDESSRVVRAGSEQPRDKACNQAHQESMEHVRLPLRNSDLSDAEKAQRLVDAFRTLLPAVTTLVEHHFRRVLLAVAQEHLESVGEEHELAAASAEAARRLDEMQRGENSVEDLPDSSGQIE